MSEVTLNLAIVSATMLIALGMFRGSVRSVAENRKYFVFCLKLPLKIRFTFVGGEQSSEVERVMEVIESSQITKDSGAVSRELPGARLQRPLDVEVPKVRETG